MTGIGFLGAGVIYKEGLTVRGLTTAGSIWMTAAIGILFGVGFYFPAVLATGLSLVVLSAFRIIEIRLPSETYLHLSVGFARDKALSEPELRALLDSMGFSIASLTYAMKPVNGGSTSAFEFSMVIRTDNSAQVPALAQALHNHERVVTFELDPASS